MPDIQKSVIGFMDKTDFECELGHVEALVYPSIDALKCGKAACWEECGIVEVEVRLVRVIVPTDLREGERENDATV